VQAYKLRSFPTVNRDMDLIREILILINDGPQYDGTTEFYYETPEEFGIQNHSREEVAYHLALLIQSGYIDGAVTMAVPMQTIRALTMQGHDFLGSIRDPGIWNKTKERLSGLPGVALTVVAQIALAETKKYLHLS